MGMQVQDGHVTTIQGQICPGPCLIGLSNLSYQCHDENHADVCGNTSMASNGYSLVQNNRAAHFVNF